MASDAASVKKKRPPPYPVYPPPLQTTLVFRSRRCGNGLCEMTP